MEGSQIKRFSVLHSSSQVKWQKSICCTTYVEWSGAVAAAGGHCSVATRPLHARSDRSQASPTRHSRLVTSYDNPPADLVSSAGLADQVIAQYATFSPPNLISNLSIFSTRASLLAVQAGCRTVNCRTEGLGRRLADNY